MSSTGWVHYVGEDVVFQRRLLRNFANRHTVIATQSSGLYAPTASIPARREGMFGLLLCCRSDSLSHTLPKKQTFLYTTINQSNHRDRRKTNNICSEILNSR